MMAVHAFRGWGGFTSWLRNGHRSAGPLDHICTSHRICNACTGMNRSHTAQVDKWSGIMQEANGFEVDWPKIKTIGM
jgi:Fe2+ or Zn2+ uptake regulation protein